ncbi:MAG: hypothetical protein M1817_000627 [Caeruleum heppii]|nr:MAG: hypothetical protein M1817_000627 [Caeruleum heppii]
MPFEKSTAATLTHPPTDARVPIPPSLFPSTYRNTTEESSTTKVEVDVDAHLPRHSRLGRETRSSVSAEFPDRHRDRYEEDITVYAEEDHHRRPRRREERVSIHAERDHHPDVEITHESHRYQEPRDEPIDQLDITQREYRRRTRPDYAEEFERDYSTEPRGTARVEIHETIDRPSHEHSRMGYYDREGEYHSFRHGVEKATDRLLHPRHHHHTSVHEDVYINEAERAPRPPRAVREDVRCVEREYDTTDTITIPCHHIRNGDIVMLQGRPCQVIRITTSSHTGQHRYLGVDLFTKQLHEESSFVSNPSPSVIVQNMLGPVFRQYRVLDIRDDGRVVAMTETGDVKQSLPVIDQGGLWQRLGDAFAHGRGSLRVLVVNDRGRELAVDYKVIHGSRL